MPETTLSEIEQLRAEAAAADAVFEMDEEAFRALYDRTARALWAYLSRITGSPDLADDLLQETYYRFLRARVRYESDAHRRNSLFRIATNLVRDTKRAPRPVFDEAIEMANVAAPDAGADAESRTDVRRALGRLKPRERAMLWLAYANGSSHAEIADVLGLKTASIKLLLFRARRKLAATLQRQEVR